MKSRKKETCNKSRRVSVHNGALRPATLFWLSLALLPFSSPALARRSRVPQEQGGRQEVSSPTASTGQQPPVPQSSGPITGRVVDPTGHPAAGATVRLTRDDPSASQETLSDDDGQFSFANVPPGPFHLAISSSGFATQVFDGILSPGENFAVPQISLNIATSVTEIHVVPPTFEVAEEQIKEQEKQRPLGFIPNFYVTYIPNAAPLAPRQKFELAAKVIVDPVTFGLTAAIAGIQQSDDELGGYGQGAQGYAKRYGAAYADTVTGTLIGSAILPSLLKQDPRYFYKGTGSKRSRVLYAMATSVICKGDNGRWQPNYSGILGSLAAGGISNLYYPAHDRGVGLTFENTLIGIGATAAANILQEFVIRKLTPNVPNHDPGTSSKLSNQITRFFGKFAHEGD